MNNTRILKVSHFKETLSHPEPNSSPRVSLESLVLLPILMIQCPNTCSTFALTLT